MNWHGIFSGTAGWLIGSFLFGFCNAGVRDFRSWWRRRSSRGVFTFRTGVFGGGVGVLVTDGPLKAAQYELLSAYSELLARDGRPKDGDQFLLVGTKFERLKNGA